MAEYKLELKGVCKSFPGVKALDNVQLSLRPGTVHALMGENGAGKSTLMKCLFSVFTEWMRGKSFWMARRLRSTTDEAMKYGIAMVHQELQLSTCKKRGREPLFRTFPRPRDSGHLR